MRITRQNFYDYLLIIQEIYYKKKELDVLETKLSNVSSPKFDGMPKVKKAVGHLDNMLDKKVKLSCEIDKLCLKADEEKIVLEKCILLLNPKEKLVLRCRYLYNFAFSVICKLLYSDNEDFEIEKDMKYKSSLRKLHDNALIKIEKQNK